MNNITNKFLLVGDKFMSAMRLRQPGFLYNACRPLKGKTKQDYKN